MEFPAASALAVAAFLLVSAASPGGAEYKKTEYLVRPNSLNRRGIIGPGRICPKNTYAIGFKMKVKESNEACPEIEVLAAKLLLRLLLL